MTIPAIPVSFWKKCSICKTAINFNTKYYLCNVSTCRSERTGMRFCSVTCWDAHLGYVNHRSEVYAEENKSPTAESMNFPESGSQREPVRKIVADIKATDLLTTEVKVNHPVALQANDIKSDTLVVVSKVKKIISDQSDFNTSQCCIDRLTKKVIEECLKGIKKAELAGRKTVMGRDIE